MVTQTPDSQPGSPQVPPTVTDAQIMSGVPGGPITSAPHTPGTTPASGNTSLSPAAATSAPPAGKPTEIYLGGRKFNSVEELAAHTQELQNKADIADRIQSAINPATGRPVDPEEEIAEMIYTDPKKAIRSIKEMAKQEMRQENAQLADVQNLKAQFYSTNADLANKQELVEFFYGRMEKELANMSIVDATSKLANAVRAKLADWKGEKVATQELSNTTPRVAGAGSGAPSEGTPVAAPQTMTEQLRAFQKRGTRTPARH